MNEALLEAFRHHAWATGEVLAACRKLPDGQLTASATGTYGDVLGTLNHLIGADGRYLWRLGETAPDWAVNREEAEDLAELEARAEVAARGWEQWLAGPIDPDRVLVLDDGTYECPVGIVIAQALHHGNAHREQICAILTGLGMQPPDVQPWAYADATGRSKQREPTD